MTKRKQKQKVVKKKIAKKKIVSKKTGEKKSLSKTKDQVKASAVGKKYDKDINEMFSQYLVAKKKKGKNQAKNLEFIRAELMDACKGFLLSVVHKRVKSLQLQSDALQEAYVALVKALEGYKSDKKTKFTTYLWGYVDKSLLSFVLKENKVMSGTDAKDKSKVLKAIRVLLKRMDLEEEENQPESEKKEKKKGGYKELDGNLASDPLDHDGGVNQLYRETLEMVDREELLAELTWTEEKLYTFQLGLNRMDNRAMVRSVDDDGEGDGRDGEEMLTAEVTGDNIDSGEVNREVVRMFSERYLEGKEKQAIDLFYDVFAAPNPSVQEVAEKMKISKISLQRILRKVNKKIMEAVRQSGELWNIDLENSAAKSSTALVLNRTQLIKDAKSRILEREADALGLDRAMNASAWQDERKALSTRENETAGPLALLLVLAAAKKEISMLELAEKLPWRYGIIGKGEKKKEETVMDTMRRRRDRDIADLAAMGYAIMRKGNSIWLRTEKDCLEEDFSLTAGETRLIEDMLHGRGFGALSDVEKTMLHRFVTVRSSGRVAVPALPHANTNTKNLAKWMGAAEEKRFSVNIRYSGAKSSSTSAHLSPYGCFLHDGATFLVGWHHQEKIIKVYPLTEVLRVDLTEEAFVRPNPGFDLATYVYGNPKWCDKLLRALVKVSGGDAELVSKRYTRFRESTNVDEQSHMFNFYVNDRVQFYRFLLRLGPSAEVLEPLEIREGYRAFLREAI